jgi:protein SCO1/2
MWMMSRWRLFAGVFLAGLILIGLTTLATWLSARAAPELHGRELGGRPAAELGLTSAAGRRVNLAELRDKVVLVYFGYTFCPDVCPTTLSDLRKVMRALGPLADDVQVLMVSVDPERDAPDRVDEYVKRFDPRFIGLSGSAEEVAAAAAAYDVYYAREAGSAATGYLVTHSSSVTLIDPAGRLRLAYAYGTPPADIAADIRQLLAR